MLTIRPFRGIRYNSNFTGIIHNLIAPPYDIIYDEWRERLYARHPNNIIRIIKTKNDSEDTTPDTKYSHAADYFTSWMDKGILAYEDEPAVYVCADTYTVKTEVKTRYGFIALLKIEEFGHGIYPHEQTLASPKEDRLKLVKSTGANFSQIFSIFRDPDDSVQNVLITAASRDPDVSFTDEEGVIRNMWIVKDPETILTLQRYMSDCDVIIADGHHRYETALTYKHLMEPTRTTNDEPFDYIPMYFSNVDAPGMTILPTHRKVSGLNPFRTSTFFSELEKEFDITSHGNSHFHEALRLIAQDSERNNTFAIYTSDGFRIARYRHPAIPKDLDVEILHRVIIEGILRIPYSAITAGKYVHFSKSPEHLIEDVNNGIDQVSFLLNGVKPEELFRKVLQGVRMPQKSTYFYPKTLSGLVIYKIDRASFR